MVDSYSTRLEWSFDPLEGVGILGVWVFLRGFVADAPVAATPALALVDGLLAASALCFGVALAGYWVDLPQSQSTVGTLGAVLAFAGGVGLGVDAALGLAAADGWAAVGAIAGAVVLVLVGVPLVVGATARVVLDR